MKKHPTLFWCDACNKAVEPSNHDVTESTEFWGEKTWEAFHELRCPLCGDDVAEEIACLECKEARPEDGADHCAACLAKFEAEELQPLAAGPLHPEAAPNNPIFGSFSMVDDIGRYVRDRETPTHEAVGHIRWIGGKPVVSIVRELKPQGLDALLRVGSDLPLFRRQAG
jgi:hypothetical protein